MAIVLGWSATGANAQSPTRTAAGFRDSVGINTSPTYDDTPYARWGDVIAWMRELGVAHMRSGISASDDAFWNARFYAQLTAVADAGVKLQLIVHDSCSPDHNIDRCLDAVRTRLPAGSVDALEWPDERDRRGGSWAPILAAWGRLLYAKVKTDAALRHLHVIGPALVRSGSPAKLGDQSASLDRGNIHPYTGATSPAPGTVRDAISGHRAVFSTKPVVATEAGFNTALLDRKPDQPAADEATAAVYTLRTLLEHFAAGIERTFLYELVDQGADPRRSEYGYGLLRSDFSPKPAFSAVKNLLRMVGRTGPMAVTPLLYRVTGTTPDLRELVLQQDARSYLLILWRTASVWNRDTKQSLPVEPRSYGIDVPGLVAFARGNPLSGPALMPGTIDGGRIIQRVGAAPTLLRLAIRPGGQAGLRLPGTAGAPGTNGDASGRSGDRDTTPPRIRTIKVRRITRTRYAVYFRLSEAARVGARLDRARKGSRGRYRLLRRVAARQLRSGTRRRIVVGRFKVGRHRVLLSARDAASSRYVLKAFKIRHRSRR
jgi:hypothetical protein